ncbi:MAG: site-specific DNA-methyltransferase, partial [Turicibacter bilis]|nr:site-specific DNA-methyltransferase [Turicibacter bilis]
MQKLELTWIGKGKEPLLEPRILIHDKEKSYGDENTENMLIHGDNLLALKSLEQDYTGQIKCIYIDPPYNIGVANPNYDDNVPHSEWLSLIAERIKILYRLLSNKGLLWISIDDDECHYLKVVCDEIFGRNNFVSDITYERSGSAGLGQGGLFVNTTEHIL